MVRWGAAWRAAVTVLCVIGVLAPAAAGAADPQDKLDRVEEELEEAESGLRGVEERKAVELADLQRIDARLAELNAELKGLNERLAVAEGELAESRAQLERTTQRLLAVEAELDDTRRRLEKSQDAFDARARSTYMYGGQANWAALVVGIESIGEFERGLKYARSVLHHDRERIERIGALEATVERTTIELARLQDERATQRTLDAQRRDAAAAIVAEREAVTDKVAAEAEKHRLLVAQLESDRQSYVAMVADLEAQGEQLEAQLRQRAEEQRQRELAAQQAAAAAAERDRVAAADRSSGSGGGGGGDSDAGQTSPGVLLWPASGAKTSDFGWRTHPIFGTRRMHTGMDIGAPSGTPIWAAADGVVVSAGGMGGYGNAVVVDHGGGMATLSAHQSSIAVSAGQSVQRGQIIGYVGSTGYSTGPHLHFEVRINGTPVNPVSYF